MKVIIIKGNPKFINNEIAIRYYIKIATFLKKLGAKEVLFDSGEPKTCPSMATFYVAHSRGCGRVRMCESLGRHNSVLLGDPDGVIHPVDAEWQRVTPAGTGTPPKEHFLFTKEQQAAVKEMYDNHWKVHPKSSDW